MLMTPVNRMMGTMGLRLFKISRSGTFAMRYSAPSSRMDSATPTAVPQQYKTTT